MDHLKKILIHTHIHTCTSKLMKENSKFPFQNLHLSRVQNAFTLRFHYFQSVMIMNNMKLIDYSGARFDSSRRSFTKAHIWVRGYFLAQRARKTSGPLNNVNVLKWCLIHQIWIKGDKIVFSSVFSSASFNYFHVHLAVLHQCHFKMICHPRKIEKLFH